MIFLEWTELRKNRLFHQILTAVTVVVISDITVHFYTVFIILLPFTIFSHKCLQSLDTTGYWFGINQSSNQFNSNLVAREPDSK